MLFYLILSELRFFLRMFQVISQNVYEGFIEHGYDLFVCVKAQVFAIDSCFQIDEDWEIFVLVDHAKQIPSDSLMFSNTTFDDDNSHVTTWLTRQGAFSFSQPKSDKFLNVLNEILLREMAFQFFQPFSETVRDQNLLLVLFHGRMVVRRPSDSLDIFSQPAAKDVGQGLRYQYLGETLLI